MQRLKFTKEQKLRAARIHKKCWHIDQKKLRNRRKEVENGVYRVR